MKKAKQTFEKKTILYWLKQIVNAVKSLDGRIHKDINPAYNNNKKILNKNYLN